MSNDSLISKLSLHQQTNRTPGSTPTSTPNGSPTTSPRSTSTSSPRNGPLKQTHLQVHKRTSVTRNERKQVEKPERLSKEKLTLRGLTSHALNRYSLELKDEHIIMPYIFGRKVTQNHLKDVLSLGMCNHDINKIVSSYLNQWALFIYNSNNFFIQNCFNVQSTNDIFMPLMIKYLNTEIKPNYLIMLGMVFQGKFMEYLNISNTNNLPVEESIDNTIRTFNEILNITELKTLSEGLLIVLYHTILDKQTTWEKKGNIFVLIDKLVDKKCFDCNNKILIHIINETKELMKTLPWEVLAQAVYMTGKLAKAQLLTGIEPKVIEGILSQAKELLDHENKAIMQSTLSAIAWIAKAGLMEGVPFELIGQILDKANGLLLSHEREKIITNTLFTIETYAKLSITKWIKLKAIRSQLIENKKVMLTKKEARINIRPKSIQQFKMPNLLDEVELKRTSNMLIQATQLLSHKDESIVKFAIVAIGQFIKAELLNGKSLEKVEKILEETINKLNHEEGHVVKRALLLITQFAETGLLKENEKIKEVLIEATKLLNHQEKSLVKIAITTVAMLTQTGLLKTIDNSLIDDFLDQASKKKIKEMNNLLLTIALDSQKDKLDEVKPTRCEEIENVLINAEKLLSYNDKKVIEFAICTILAFGEADLLKGVSSTVIDGIFLHAQRFSDKEIDPAGFSGIILYYNQ